MPFPLILSLHALVKNRSPAFLEGSEAALLHIICAVQQTAESHHSLFCEGVSVVVLDPHCPAQALTSQSLFPNVEKCLKKGENAGTCEIAGNKPAILLQAREALLSKSWNGASTHM